MRFFMVEHMNCVDHGPTPGEFCEVCTGKEIDVPIVTLLEVKPVTPIHFFKYELNYKEIAIEKAWEIFLP